MAETQKKLKIRMVQKHGTFEEWEDTEDFIPLKGELIIYTDGAGREPIPRFKVGDGVTTVQELPFATADLSWKEF